MDDLTAPVSKFGEILNIVLEVLCGYSFGWEAQKSACMQKLNKMISLHTYLQWYLLSSPSLPPQHLLARAAV